MTPGGSRPYCSPRRNLFSLDPVEDELARDPGPVRGPHSGSTSPAPSCNPIPGPKLVPALIPALIPAPVPAPVPTLVSAPVPTLVPAPALFSSDKLFKQFIKAYLESNKRPRQPPAEREQSFKAKVPKVYYGKLYMDCYHFCQQCKDHFETAKATGTNRTPFATSFFCGSISVQ